MTQQPRPPIPPLSEVTVARIERRVFAALDEEELLRALPQRRGWRLALILAPVVGLLAFAAMRLTRPAAGLPEGTRIATAGTASHVTIQGAAVDVAPRSAIAIGGEPDGTTVLLLERGAVTCQVAPRRHRAPFVVQAGTTRVTVVGTRFTVERQGDHASVSVEHGVVEVTDDGVTQILHGGERYRPTATLPATAAAAVLPAVIPRPVIGRDRPRAQPPERRIALTPAVVPPPVAPPAPAPAVAAPTPASPVIAPPSTQQRFEEALRLETTDPLAALRQYQELAGGTDAWAANALFAAGRLELERGQHREARGLLESYLKRFPEGNNREDARVLLQRLP